MRSCIEQLSLSEEGSSSNVSQNELTISKIYYAYENSKELLDILQHSFLLDESFGGKIFRQISKIRKSPNDIPLRLEIILLEEVINLCDQTQISSREEALKYVIEIRRWIGVVDKTLAHFGQNCEDYQQTFHTTFRCIAYQILFVIIGCIQRLS